jgi:D-glycero-alpha-D-manno-heptose-7-phosphate kinase
MRDVLTSGADLRLFGACLHNAWETKKSLEASICNPLIDGLYERGLKAGALGGKLLGAGSGGFILFYCEPEQQAQLRAAMEELIEVPFAMESQGTRVVFVGEDHF